MLRFVLGWLLLAVVVVGCSPSVSVPGVTVHIPAVVPAPAPVRPGVHVFYSDLDRFELAEALGHAAEVVHPRYEVANAAFGVGRIRYAGDELAETYMRDLSNGRTALLVYPEDLAAEPRLQPVIEAFEAAGVLTDSGLPELQPVPVDAAAISVRRELFRYYSGVTEGQLGWAALDCRSDYLIGSAHGSSGSFGTDETVMPDGRVRLYVTVHDSGRDLVMLEETRTLIGLMFACLDARLGPGQEA